MATGKNLSIDSALNLVPERLLVEYETKSLAACEVLLNELHCGTCDLHLYTAASYGTDSVGDLLKLVVEKKLYAFSITDRDTMEGVRNMLVLVEKLLKLGLPLPHFIRGMEMSSQGFGRPMELLAYFPIEGSGIMFQYLSQQRQNRQERNRKMCEKLQALGFPVTLEELEAENPHVVGRLQAANILVRKGYAMSNQEAFQLWLAKGRPAYVPYEAPAIEDCIRQVREANGVPVLSHPNHYNLLGRQDNLLEERLAYLRNHGLMGVEVVHSLLTSRQMDELSYQTRNLGLISTSGSGYSGYNKKEVQMFDNKMDFSRWIQ